MSFKMISRPKDYSYFKINSIPSVFITLGLLGTFLGITLGLLEFDTSPDKIKKSITTLLSGLKYAFFTSIVGIFLSLFFSRKIRELYGHRKVNEPESIEYDTLKEISSTLKSIKQENENQTPILTDLKSNITTQTAATTIVSKKIDNLSRTLGESNAEAITNALKNIIQDFNDTFKNFIEKLVDKNFDKLTESINQLINWQSNYKEQITNLTEAYQTLVNKHKQLVINTENWVQTLDKIAGSSSELQNIIKDFKAVFNEESNFSFLIEKIENSISNLKISSDNIMTLSQNINKVNEAFSETKEEITTWLNREEGVRDAVMAHSEAIIELRKFDISSIENLDKSFYDRLGNTFNQLDSLLKEYINYLEEKMKD